MLFGNLTLVSDYVIWKLTVFFQYDGWPSGMDMPAASMYGDHRAALDTIAAHHAAAAQHMNHSSRNKQLLSTHF